MSTRWFYVIGRNEALSAADAVVIGRVASWRHRTPDVPAIARRTEIALMDSQHLIHATGERGRRGCLVEGCPCKDARIVSTRRTAFFAEWARKHGETADRTVAAELDWRIPTLISPAA
jgi:hypothetical protein